MRKGKLRRCASWALLFCPRSHLRHFARWPLKPEAGTMYSWSATSGIMWPRLRVGLQSRLTAASITWSFFAILSAATALTAQDVSKKSPVPDPTARAEAMKLVKGLYGDENASAKTPSLKKALAEKLIQKADDIGDNSAQKYVLLFVAREITAQAADVKTAFAAVDAVAESFEVNAVETKEEVLSDIAKKARLPSAHKAVASAATVLIAQALQNDQFELAARLGEQALAEADLAHDPKLKGQIEGQIRRSRSNAGPMKK